MSLQTDVKYKGVLLSLHKIIKIELCDFVTGVIRFVVASFATEQAKNQNSNNYLNTRSFTVRSEHIDLTTDIRSELYKWLKTQDEFKASKDC